MERRPNDKLSTDQITSKLEMLPNWEFCEKHNAIEKDFKRNDFIDAVNFIQSIAEVAEEADHHPDLLLHDYKNLRVILTTHSAGGITQNDFDLATSIETIE
jgi:4a-hydroxytetrahydrobiopterin dehydratase